MLCSKISADYECQFGMGHYGLPLTTQKPPQGRKNMTTLLNTYLLNKIEEIKIKPSIQELCFKVSR